MNDKLGLGNLNPELPEEDRAEDDDMVDVAREVLATTASRLCRGLGSPDLGFDSLNLYALSPVGNRCKPSCPTDSGVPSLADVDGVDGVWLSQLLALPLTLPLPPLLLLMILLSDSEDWEWVLCCEREVARAILVIMSTGVLFATGRGGILSMSFSGTAGGPTIGDGGKGLSSSKPAAAVAVMESVISVVGLIVV